MINQIIHRTSIIISIQIPIEKNILSLKEVKEFFNTNSSVHFESCQVFYKHSGYPYQIYQLESKGMVSDNFNVVIYSRDIRSVSYEITTEIIKTAKREGAIAEIIWDDIALNNAEIAYPLIHKLENKYRSTLNLIMNNHYGIEWRRKYFPSKLYNKVMRTIKFRENQNANSSQALLSALDFIDIEEFIFSSDQLISENKKYINYIQENENLDLEYLRSLLPQSNWERALKYYLTISEEEFKSYWSELYRIRCKIAHNRGISKEELDYVRSKTGYLSNRLNTLLVSGHMSAPEEYRVGELTIKRCGNYDIECVICYGYQYDDAKINMKLKEALMKIGYDLGETDDEASFNKEAINALIDYQKKNGLSVGTIDANTLNALKVKY